MAHKRTPVQTIVKTVAIETAIKVIKLYFISKQNPLQKLAIGFQQDYGFGFKKPINDHPNAISYSHYYILRMLK